MQKNKHSLKSCLLAKFERIQVMEGIEEKPLMMDM